MTTGSLVVFIFYLGKMYKPMRDLSKLTDTMSKAFVGYERIVEVLRTESQVKDKLGARAAPGFEAPYAGVSRIRFEGYFSARPVQAWHPRFQGGISPCSAG